MRSGTWATSARPACLLSLENLGPPVTLVRGNCDGNFDWPLVVDLTRNGVRFRLVHIPPSRAPEKIDVLLHGHTHVPRNERREGVLFLNPGCVTRPNRGAPASVAHLEIADGRQAGLALNEASPVNASFREGAAYRYVAIFCACVTPMSAKVTGSRPNW